MLKLEIIVGTIAILMWTATFVYYWRVPFFRWLDNKFGRDKPPAAGVPPAANPFAERPPGINDPTPQENTSTAAQEKEPSTPGTGL